jgi:hypothetical protein
LPIKPKQRMTVNVRETQRKIHIQDLYFEIRLQINIIKFHKQQLDILQNNLDHMVKYYEGSEIMSEVEQYQNKFIVYREVADRLIKSQKYLRNNLPDPTENNEVDDMYLNEFTKLKTKVDDFIAFIEELKDAFIFFYTSYHVSENHVYGK